MHFKTFSGNNRVNSNLSEKIRYYQTSESSKTNRLTPKRAQQIKHIQAGAQQQDPAKLLEILRRLIDNQKSTQ
jgi:hypothetical protein